MKKRLLAILLSVSMIVGLFPVATLAADLPEDAPENITMVTITEADMESATSGSTALAAAITRASISNLPSITALKVTTEGDAYLSPEDNMYIKEKFTSLTYLDESECRCSTKHLDEKTLIKSGLEDIEYEEFGGLSGFTSLQTLLMPTTAQVINSYDASTRGGGIEATGLTALTIPDGVLVLENGACSSLTAFTGDLVIPDSVVLIDNNAFGLDNMTDCGALILGNSVKYIDNNGFKNRKFTGNLVIPDSIEHIGNWAFAAGSFENGTWNLGSGLRYIGEAAMSKICSGNTGALFIPKELEIADTGLGYNTFDTVVFEEGTAQIGTRVVRNSSKITSVELPSTIETIGTQAFFECSALKTINLPEGLTTIGIFAFQNCSALTSVALPTTITTVGHLAFDGMAENSVLYAPNTAIYTLLSAELNNQWNRRYDPDKTALAITDGGTFVEGTEFEAGKLATPIRDGYVFDGWYSDQGLTQEVTDNVAEAGQTYYAKWTESSESAGKNVSLAMTYGDDAVSQKVTVNSTANDASITDVKSSSKAFEVSHDGMDVTITAADGLNAGTYTGTVYVYTGDGATHWIDVSLTVKKATLTATYKGETIRVGETPALTVDVAGFVNGETAENAAGYKAPMVSTDKTAVGSYELTPVGGEATNYDFEYVPGTLTIEAAPSTGPASYAISVADADHGTVAVNPTKAVRGKTVTITAKADAGYEIDVVKVTDHKGKAVKIAANSDGTYSFTMPASKVDVAVSFKAASVDP
ncbi:MAG: leucine-rich repeat protein, partial [Peptococcaceae bacterium]|nr:leucine-rich repeat protein [Peptococcaceae bacterium]